MRLRKFHRLHLEVFYLCKQVTAAASGASTELKIVLYGAAHDSQAKGARAGEAKTKTNRSVGHGTYLASVKDPFK